jgi:hypothetical protein
MMMESKRGNSVWVKGKSANPHGRPKGQTGLVALDAFLRYEKVSTTFLRWERLCWSLIEPPYTWTAAARKAGYSRKSARFIASRLKRNPVVRTILYRQREIITKTRKIGENEWLIPDYSGNYHIYRRKRQGNIKIGRTLKT